MTTKTDKQNAETAVQETTVDPETDAVLDPMPTPPQAPAPTPRPSPTHAPTVDEKASLRAGLENEAERLNKFKKDNIKRGDHTPCPACATVIHVNANKCPHCSSDVSAQNALTREILRKLDEVNAELAALSPAGPVLAKIKAFSTRPTLTPEMKILIPSFVAYFSLLVVLRFMGNPMAFWSVCVAGGVIGYVLLNKFRYAKFVTVESYRWLLVVGLLIVSVSALAPPMNAGTHSVVVQKPVANIRQINSTDSPVTATAKEGDRLRVFGEDNGWYNVRTADGKTGWIYGSLVSN